MYTLNWTSKEETTNTQSRCEFSTKCSLTKNIMVCVPFRSSHPTRACDWNGACETVFSFVSWFRVSNYVSRIWYCTILKKRSQYRCMSKTYNRTRNVNVHFLMMMFVVVDEFWPSTQKKWLSHTLLRRPNKWFDHHALKVDWCSCVNTNWSEINVELFSAAGPSTILIYFFSLNLRCAAFLYTRYVCSRINSQAQVKHTNIAQQCWM